MGLPNNYNVSKQLTRTTTVNKEVAFKHTNIESKVDTKMDKTKKKGESNCFHCGEPNHWDYKCPQVSEKDRAELSTTKEKVGRVHKKVSEVVEDNRDSYNVIYMLLDHKAKQRKKIKSINIYMDN